MPKVILTGNIEEAIYTNAINNLPYNGASIATIIAGNPKNHPCPPKKAFERTCAFLQHILKPGEPQQRLFAAARNLLINQYGYKPAVLDCCKMQVKSNGIVLISDGKFKSLLKNTPELSRNLINKLEKKLSDIPKVKAEKEDVLMRLTQHQSWLRDRERILSSAQVLFDMDETKLHEFAKTLPDHRANLSGMMLRNMDLSGYDLSGIICKGSKIENCILGNISGADLTGSAISNSRFTGTDMSHARLNDTRIDHVTIENYNNMAGADFTDSKQQGVSFINCQFEGALLSVQMADNLQNFNSKQNHTVLASQVFTHQDNQEETVTQNDQENEAPDLRM